MYVLFYCVVLCIVFVLMCTVLLPPGVNPNAVNKIYHIIYYIISYHIFVQNDITLANFFNRNTLSSTKNQNGTLQIFQNTTKQKLIY